MAKIIANFSIATIVWWAFGFAIAFGGAGWLAGDSGFFVQFGSTISTGSLIEGEFTGASSAFFLFQFMFCAVSLAIVWGTTLERTKFIAYAIFAVVFAGVIYPIVAHWGFGGGLFAEIGNGVQDFAGSSVVHLTGATAAFAALLLLGPRKGKFGPDGISRAIPGHSMPIFGLGVLILWLGWFGFNAGSTLGTSAERFAEVAVVTQLAAAAGVHHRLDHDRADLQEARRGHGRQRRDRRPRRHHGTVGLRRVLGGADHRRRGGRPRGRLRAGHRQGARRPGRRALGARHRGHLGHALVRHLHRHPASRRRWASATPASSTAAA